MTTHMPDGDKAMPYRPVHLPRRKIDVERRADGSLVLRSATPPPAITQTCFADFIPLWAQQRGATPAFCERGADGQWRSISWSELWQSVQSVAAGLLDLGLGPSRPLVLLSGNSIEQAVLLLAAEYVGIASVPVSPAYSTLSRDFNRLKRVRQRVPPGAVFVQALEPYERALHALDLGAAPVIVVTGAVPGQVEWQTLATTPLTAQRQATIARARAAITSDSTVRILFTSGSTGLPKGVRLTYGNFKAVAAYYADNLAWLAQSQPVFLDWLPWYHGLGGVLNLGRSVQFGATHYIDDGRPLPGLFDRTLRNLREVAPSIFTTVPSAWTLLAGELERDPVLARNLCSNAYFFGYGGASLPASVWRRIQAVAEQTVGERIVFCTGLASTETCGMGTYCGWPCEGTGNIGTPVPGTEVKLLPLAGGRYELRMRGPQLFAGYVQDPQLSAAAFDEEGFFLMGDAVRLVDPGDPAAGMEYAGRVVEDFKLASGTWVQTGAMRLALLDRCAPLLSDAVICGHDRDYLGALAWPNVVACQKLAPELAGLDAHALAKHPLIVSQLRERLQMQPEAGASLTIERLMLMGEPPSADANEIADKGYVNQAATRARRALLVEALFQDEPAGHIARRG